MVHDYLIRNKYMRIGPERTRDEMAFVSIRCVEKVRISRCRVFLNIVLALETILVFSQLARFITASVLLWRGVPKGPRC